MAEKPPLNRRQRRAERSGRGQLKAIEGGKPSAPDTPAQRLGVALEAFMKQYLQGHGGIDAMNATKVVMQYAAHMALDFNAEREEYLLACGAVFDEEQAARRG